VQTEPVIETPVSYAIYTVVKCDTLWDIAGKYLGDNMRYVEIMSLNGLTSNIIEVGQVLKLYPISYSAPITPTSPVLRFPVNGIFVSTPFSSSHYAADLAFNEDEYHISRNQEIIAPFNMQITRSGYDDNVGNYIYATVSDYQDRYDLVMRFIHMSDRIGTGYVVEGQRIGNMGNTGIQCNGYHLHVDCWLMPKGVEFVFTPENRAKYAIDPLTVFHVKNGQIAGDVTAQKYKLKYA
jgi:murein DD-endopeptidase MepM/ murein hydrolase activator NlpD